MEPQVNINFNSSELQTLAALLDTAVKATGLQGARAALPLIDKLEKAVAEANAPKANVTPDFKGVPLNSEQEAE